MRRNRMTLNFYKTSSKCFSWEIFTIPLDNENYHCHYILVLDSIICISNNISQNLTVQLNL